LFPPAYRQINRMRKWRLHEPNVDVPYRFLGSSYGGWSIPVGLLDESSIAYTVGVGEDITFDLALIEECHCRIFAFDPTPNAIEYMRTREIPGKLTFVPVGFSSTDGSTTFFQPVGFNSLYKGINPHAGAATQMECETLTLATVMQRLGHDRVDLLKIDIEGFEYEVIEQMISAGTLPKCLLVEFHHLMFGIGVEPTLRSVELLAKAGYRIFWVSNGGHEYGFLSA